MHTDQNIFIFLPRSFNERKMFYLIGRLPKGVQFKIAILRRHIDDHLMLNQGLILQTVSNQILN